MPLDELLAKIFVVVKLADLEKRRLHKAHQVLDAAFLPRLIGPTQLHTDADLQCGAGKDLIPFRHFSFLRPFQSDGFRPVEHAQQRASTPILKMLRHSSH